MTPPRTIAMLMSTALVLGGCGGGSPNNPPPPPTPTPTPGRLYTPPAAEFLTTGDVERVLGQAIAEAQARGLPAAIAVTDRVGNVLAVYRMTGARATATTLPAPNGQSIDAQDVTFPAEAGAIAKAVTGAYLSSGGNAFTTRTASQIVQQHFPPAPNTIGLESGPLFGVQFSQLPCSDLSARFAAGAAMIGPKRSPLGLAADPGGLPLYKNGVLVGGVGVMGDGVYGFDPDIVDFDNDPEEAIALAASQGFEPPVDIRADRINVDGTALRFADPPVGGLTTPPASPAALIASAGALVAVRGYFGDPVPVIIAGTVYGSEASGIRPATAAEFNNLDAYVLTDGSGNPRFPVRAGTDGSDVAQPISFAEARALLEEAFVIMSRARAQIRRPLDSRAQVTISLVDTHGSILGVVRAPDAPIFGTDVSLQKARTAAFFSNAAAGAQLIGNPSADVQQFVGAIRTFLSDPTALTGAFAFSDRAGGNLSRPFFPDGEVARPNGPLSRPIAQFNPFSTGLQSALVIGNVAGHLGFVAGTAPTDTPQRCTTTPDIVPGQNRLQNGIQIFPGSVPIYRGSTLVGAIGVSGDGIDQDDMIAFLGTNNGGARAGGGIGNAPADRRADRIVVDLGNAQVRLRYINCPFAPFLDTAAQNVCQGL